ncbi:MAG TPA: ComEC/Rec2 family competence protein [Bosea sp. (in: a-proteobacteria)]|jgi:competence protein ComEC|uniref:ComEC/Rec2 family competence protein n=1 Tax=Bosea sp. (in: a-proteobacteria) TaxID=1871050 RepID=UPI002E158B44|nr:ComEC/Rec2 family competence protein [Bosea sp. (in: a-proteobacteria)]
MRLGAMLETEVERRRLFNWLPVPLGLGVILYFLADREPGLIAPLLGFALSALAASLLRHKRLAMAICMGFAAVFAGFAAGAWRTASIAAPALARLHVGKVTGFIEALEQREKGVRLVLLVTDMPGVDPQQRPRRIRVSTAATTLKPGDHIVATARLLPPPGPARPGGYDFARDAFFRGIGAVGSIAGKVALAPAPVPQSRQLAWSVAIDQARNALTERIATIGGGQAGAMAAALVTGKRGLITEPTNDDLRAAGIYHIVSISGLHMVLAAGTIFWLARALLALSPGIALFWPVKKIAALAAMFGATAYCVFSGAEVATVRSLIMTLVMLGAILVDRPALSMRNLALAAIIVLLREPEALLGPSFQMSFGAVAALIAFAERWQERPPDAAAASWPWPLRPLWLSAVGIIVTTLLATAATAPFGVYHFQTFNPFGLLGNALALPFVSLIVMPAAVFGVLAYPFGLDWPAWALMGWASGLVLQLAHWVAGIERSTMVLPAFDAVALALFALALLWLTLWTTALRFLAALPLCAGLALASDPTRPDILIERDGSGILVRGAEGRLVLAGKPSRFVLTQWLHADGDSRPPDGATLREDAACDARGCVIRLKDGRSVAYTKDRIAIVEDCQRADLVVTPLHVNGTCTARLIDRAALARDGATALGSVRGGSWRAYTAEDATRLRPWTRVKPAPAAPSPAEPARAPAAPSSAAAPIEQAEDSGMLQ